MYAFYMYLCYAHPYEGKYTFYSDSAYLVDGFLEPRYLVCSGRAVHADLWQLIHGKVDDLGSEVVELSKVAAHRSIRSAEHMYDSLKILGNARADELAKRGAGVHPKNELLYNSIAQYGSA